MKYEKSALTNNEATHAPPRMKTGGGSNKIDDIPVDFKKGFFQFRLINESHFLTPDILGYHLKEIILENSPFTK